MDHLIERVRARGRLDDPLVRQRLAQSWIDVEIFRLHNARTLARLARGEEIGPESSVVKLFWAGMSQRLYETAVASLGPDALLMPTTTAPSTRPVGARAARVARQLDHGRHERDPAQHHRRAPARAPAGADGMTSRRRRPRPRRSRALRRARVSARRRGRGCGPRRRSRTSHPTGSSRSGRSRSTPTSSRSPSSRCASRARQGITLLPAGAVMPPSEMVVMLDPPKHGPVRRVANAALHPAGGAGAPRPTSSASRSRSSTTPRAARRLGRARLRRAHRGAVPARRDRLDPRRAERRLGAAVPLDQRGHRQGRSRVPARRRDARCRRSSGRAASCTRTSSGCIDERRAGPAGRPR